MSYRHRQRYIHGMDLSLCIHLCVHLYIYQSIYLYNSLPISSAFQTSLKLNPLSNHLFFPYIYIYLCYIGMILPGCQDTGTGIILGKRGQYVLTDGKDEEHLSRGVYDTYTNTNLRSVGRRKKCCRCFTPFNTLFLIIILYHTYIIYFFL